MTIKIYKSIITLVFIAFTGLVFGQNNTLYFMNSIPQATNINPSVQHQCKMDISGAIVPIAGQFLLPVTINAGINSFAYKDFIYSGTGIKSDSLITAFDVQGDADKFLNKLKPTNYISTDFNLSLLHAGYKYKDYYITFDLNERFEARASFPKDILVLGWEGNGKSFLGNEADLSNFGMSATYFREYAFGVTKELNDKWTVGGKAKMLFGKMNVSTKKSDLTFNTNDNDFAYTIATDMEFNMSNPFMRVDEFQYDNEGDSMAVSTTDLDPDAKSVLMNNNNFGLGVDLGATYKVNDKYSLFASVIDLGYINWKDNTSTFTNKGEFKFDGWDIVPSLQGNDVQYIENGDTLSATEHNTDQFVDSLTNIFDIAQNSEAYKTKLTPKIYIGGTYTINEKINVGALVRTDIYKSKLHPSVTLSANTQFTKWFAATVTYSWINNSFANVGFGYMLKAGPVQFYMVTDNVLGAILPETARVANFRMGVNLIFGCKTEGPRSLSD